MHAYVIIFFVSALVAVGLWFIVVSGSAVAPAKAPLGLSYAIENGPSVRGAAVLGALRQHEMTEASENLNGPSGLEIAERQLGNEGWRNGEELYRIAFNSIDEGFCFIEMIFDEHGHSVDYRFLEVNPSFAKQTGLPLQVAGKRMRELAPNLEAHWFEILGEVALSGLPVRFEHEAKALNRWFDIYAFRIGGPETRRVGVIFSNTTVRKEAEAAFRRAQSQLAAHASKLEGLASERAAELTATNDQMKAIVYSIAHDLRAPLRSMEGFSEILVEEAGPFLNETCKDYAHRINRSARFMDALLGELLAFSRISRQTVDLSAVALNDVIGSVLSRLDKEIREKDARVINLGVWPVVQAHEATLGEVLLHLTTNALKFVAPHTTPEVRLWAEEHSGLVRVWVEDNGIGIAPSHQDQVFGLFTRLNGPSYGGTGIGLAIVKKGLERMGGRVGMDSASGRGSRFWIELRKA